MRTVVRLLAASMLFFSASCMSQKIDGVSNAISLCNAFYGTFRADYENVTGEPVSIYVNFDKDAYQIVFGTESTMFNPELSSIKCAGNHMTATFKDNWGLAGDIELKLISKTSISIVFNDVYQLHESTRNRSYFYPDELIINRVNQ